MTSTTELRDLLDERDRLAGEVERLKGLLDDALDRVEDLEREAETVSAEFEKDCWIAVRSFLTKVGFKDFSDGITAQDACDIILESIEGVDKRAEAAESLSASLAERVKELEAKLNDALSYLSDAMRETNWCDAEDFVPEARALLQPKGQ